MYEIIWDRETGGILLTDSPTESLKAEVRPVFYEELDLLNLNSSWSYPRCREPLLWATSTRRYFHKGELVAEANGGGFFERPEVVVHRKDLELKPMAVSQMIARNSPLLQGLVHRALEFIHKTQQKYRKKVDISAVAFSGGKDSLVLLDLVQRALMPDQFVVVFGDTSMEITSTLKAVKKAQKRWDNLHFYTARSTKDAQTTWREFGPPSRIHRWCCTVHKSAPTLLLLRELVGKPAVKALIYDGIRWEESQARSGYNPITVGGKHYGQINASPILKWNAGEVFLYIMERDILFNDAYRHGLARVGCAVCPLAPKWWDSLAWLVYRRDIERFLEVLKKYGCATKHEESEILKYINEGGWKGRAGGRNIDEGGNRVLETEHGNSMTFMIRHPHEEWLEWAKALGSVKRCGEYKGEIETVGSTYPFKITRYDQGLEVDVQRTNLADRFFISRLRAVAFKTAYCTHCRGCEVECPTGALSVNQSIRIDEDRCIHCHNCLSFIDKGCLAAKSLAVSKDGSRMKGLNRYQHFGMRTTWLHDYFQDPEQWWHENSLGNRQFEAMRVWLREAEIVSRNKITQLGSTLVNLGADSALCWAIIWTNLARNSALVNWYVNNIPWKSVHTKNELVDMLDPSLAPSSRQNAITSLVGLLRDTPLGTKLGFGEVQPSDKRTVCISKNGWVDADPLAVLYSLYRYAEKVGRYSLSLSELFQEAVEGPHMLFGISLEELARLLKGISSRYESYLSVELVKDLDNIYLNRNTIAEDILTIG